MTHSADIDTQSRHATQIRIEYAGAIYHIMSRGDRRGDIFHDDVDRHDFLKTVGEASLKTDFQIHAYCLMPNQIKKGVTH